MTVPLTVTVELDLDGVWTDITSYVRISDGPLVITRGRRGEQGSPSPAMCSFAVNNRDGRFSPRNPTGAYYGTIGRNTPVRVTADHGTGGVVRFVGEMAEWPIGWEPSESDIWVDVQAAGLRRRLSQGQTPLRGALDRATRALAGLAGYWPMSDPDGSIQFANAAAGDALTVGGSVEYADNSTAFPGVDPLPTFQGGSATAPVSGIAAGTVQMRALVFVPSGLGGLIHSLMQVHYSSGSVGYASVDLLANTGQLALQLFDSSGVFIVGASTGTVDDIRDRPVTLVMTVDQNGANVDLTLDVINAAGTVSTYTDSAASLTLGAPDRVTIGATVVASRVPPVNVAVGQLVIAGAAAAADATHGGLTGYAGETAANRIERLCTEEGITVTILGDPDTSEAMGPQPVGTLLDLLDEAAKADGGILTDDINDLALVYRTRENLYNQTPVLTLDYSARQLLNLGPVEDDPNIVNDITVVRSGGSSARAELTTGPLSTAPPPDGVGRYDSELTLNLYSDDQLAGQAAFRLALGTVDEPRYPLLAFDVMASTFSSGLRDDVTHVDEGDLITIADPPTFAGAPDDVSQLVAGWTETLTNHRWLWTLTGIPAAPYEVGEYDEATTTLSRYSNDGSVTAEALDTTETGVDITNASASTTFGDWSVTDQPFDINIGGERMRVTNLSGSGASQTLTVTRSVNGVVKSHASGVPVTLWTPARYAL